MARTKWLKIRVTDQEIVDIKKRAGRHDMSNYVRGLILDQPVAAPEPKSKKIVHSADPELVRAINRIGININQIAKQTNTEQEVDNAVLIALLNLQTTLDNALASSVPDDR
ncbi:plasmid mobilization relaxosome protein MobC [uncultured Psychrobacter sp.]|uniref:plasmid mobilization protein n=1 Tax=uncultured Psychrobacter sp. TaxID=259303 RepID=UPI0030DABCC6